MMLRILRCLLNFDFQTDFQQEVNARQGYCQFRKINVLAVIIVRSILHAFSVIRQFGFYATRVPVLLVTMRFIKGWARKVSGMDT